MQHRIASTGWEKTVTTLLEGADFLKRLSLVHCTIHGFSFCWQLQFQKLKCSNVGVDRDDEEKSL